MGGKRRVVGRLERMAQVLVWSAEVSGLPSAWSYLADGRLGSSRCTY